MAAPAPAFPPPPATEAKSAGAQRDFSGTFSAFVRLPAAQSAALNAWAAARVKPEHLWRSADATVARGGLVQDAARDVSVLLGMPRPNQALVEYLGRHARAPALRFGSTKCFDAETDAATARTYRVLYVELLAAPGEGGLPALQQAAIDGALPPAGAGPKLAWHHARYTPHVTLAFVLDEHARQYVGLEVGGLAEARADALHLKEFKRPWTLAVPLLPPDIRPHVPA